MRAMLDPRIVTSTAEPLAIAADALVVEDDASVAARRGFAAVIDQRFPQLRAARARIGAGGRLAVGAAVALPLDDPASPLRFVVWVATYGDRHAPEGRATPLIVAAAAEQALVQAHAAGARRIVMSALGTRLGTHVLPPTPKKLPRYVMGAAQLIGVQRGLAATTIERVTLSLTERDAAIFAELAGLTTAMPPEDTIDD
jgi:hypothetical protein